MIRDDFKNVKQVTKKEERKKHTMGERNFYAKEMSKLKDLNKAMSFSVKFTVIAIAIAYAFVLAVFIMSQFNSEIEYGLVRFIIWSCVFGAIAVFTLLWFIWLRPSNEKKIEKYRHELEKLNAKSLGKISAAYSLYGEDYKRELTEKHREDCEKVRAEAEKNNAEKAKDADTEEKISSDEQK